MEGQEGHSHCSFPWVKAYESQEGHSHQTLQLGRVLLELPSWAALGWEQLERGKQPPWGEVWQAPSLACLKPAQQLR